MTTVTEARSTAVPVSITTRPVGENDVEFVGDLDTLVETVMCSCSAGDDNPY
ncbi:hypothetical protein N0X72_25210 [Streptomyces carpaticus]|uniref:hypothetical protein n=1 Tax=Streptomyces carpaticus TaxID=285558 RepID=UPI0022059D87|nr:hypothetical protein N0X72_25210 [Streptomyces carpaticus]